MNHKKIYLETKTPDRAFEMLKRFYQLGITYGQAQKSASQCCQLLYQATDNQEYRQLRADVDNIIFEEFIDYYKSVINEDIRTCP